jgi:Fe(3+) dicitrate transport protein
LSSREALGFLGKVTQEDPLGNRDLIQGQFQNEGAELRYLQKYNLGQKSDNDIRGALLVGSRYYQGITESKQGAGPDGDSPDFRFLNPDNLENSSFSYPSSNLSFFAENILFLTSKWSIHVGIRQELIKSSSSGFYRNVVLHPNKVKDTISDIRVNESNYSPRAVTLAGGGSSYKFNNSISMYGNFTQNYRAINFSDLRVKNPNIQVDSAIRDEYGYTAELGFRGTWKRIWTYDVAAFYIFYGDRIGIAPQSGSVVRLRTNIGDAQNMGIEAFSEINFLELLQDSAKNDLKLFVNVAYIQSEYIRSKEKNFIGKQVEYVSPFILRSGLKFATSKWSTQVQFSYTQEQFSDASNAIFPSGDATIGLVPSYLVCDFSAKVQLHKLWSFEAGVNNFTNASYFTRRATSYPGPGILPADGISVYGTLKFQFGVPRKR